VQRSTRVSSRRTSNGVSGQFGTHLDAGDVAAHARLGQPGAGAQRAVQHRGQVALLLLGRAVGGQPVDAAVGDVHHRAQAQPVVAQLLHHHRPGGEVDAVAALRLRQGAAQVAQFGQPGHQLEGKAARRLVALDQRLHLGLHEAADAVAQRQLGVIEVEAHRGLVSKVTAGIRTNAEPQRPTVHLRYVAL
jgi:hypothetical protein